MLPGSFTLIERSFETTGEVLLTRISWRYLLIRTLERLMTAHWLVEIGVNRLEVL